MMDPDNVSLQASCLLKHVLIHRSIRSNASGESDAESGWRPIISPLTPAGLSGFFSAQLMGGQGVAHGLPGAA